MKRHFSAIALVALTATAILVSPLFGSVEPVQPQPQDPQIQTRPRVEVAFVLDTTGSMGGLIQAAKENIWSIASTLASAQPAPELKLGLVAFRDRGDAYVTRVYDLSLDLDRMYAQLMDFQADGGGDFPESVNKALHDAVFQMSWSQDPNAYKVIFLVGDAPPKVYPDEMQYPQILAAAAERGIVINTIQAGGHAETRQAWEQIASLGQGNYFQVSMAGNAVAVTTPYDQRLAELSRELDSTRLFYGDAEARREADDRLAAAEKVHVAGSRISQARRAAYNASPSGASNLTAGRELVAEVASGSVELDAIAAEHLPEALRPMAPAERSAHVEGLASRRDALQAEIRELSERRQTHIRDELAERPEFAESLDQKIFETVRDQGRRKGLEYGAGPVL